MPIHSRALFALMVIIALVALICGIGLMGWVIYAEFTIPSLLFSILLVFTGVGMSYLSYDFYQTYAPFNDDPDDDLTGADD